MAQYQRYALGDGFCLCVFDPVGAPRFPDRPRGKIHATAMLDLEHDVVLDFRSEDQEKAAALFRRLHRSAVRGPGRLGQGGRDEGAPIFRPPAPTSSPRRAGATGAPVALEFCRWHEGEEPRWSAMRST